MAVVEPHAAAVAGAGADDASVMRLKLATGWNEWAAFGRACMLAEGETAAAVVANEGEEGTAAAAAVAYAAVTDMPECSKRQAFPWIRDQADPCKCVAAASFVADSYTASDEEEQQQQHNTASPQAIAHSPSSGHDTSSWHRQVAH